MNAGDVIRWLAGHQDETWTPAEIAAATGAELHSVYYALGQLEERGWAGPQGRRDEKWSWS